MNEEQKFRDWVRRTYGVQDYMAYRNTQTEELAIQYAKHVTAQLQQHSVMQGLPTEEELWARLQELPYTKHLDDGQYNDGVIDGFEQGVRWAISKMSGSPTVASSAVASQTSARTCATGCDWPNCTLEGCVDPKCDC